tara:strand:- start:278 stop:409 length:132 start_codon:yes stop_codon:yes gene_type:complete
MLVVKVIMLLDLGLLVVAAVVLVLSVVPAHRMMPEMVVLEYKI